MSTTKPPAANKAAGGFANIVKRHPNIERTKIGWKQPCAIVVKVQYRSTNNPAGLPKPG
jgi:hypothetical protein